MKRIIILAVFTALAGSSFGQQESQFTQYYMNPYVYNPAASGTTSLVDANLGFRQQWAGMDGAPRTFFASAHSQIRLRKKDNQVLQEFRPDGAFFRSPDVSTGMVKHVVGGKVFSDQMGPFNKTHLGGSYAFHFPLIKSVNMSFGLAAGWSNFGLNTSKVNLFQSEDGAYANLVGNGGNQNFFDMQAGTHIYHKFFELGYSMTQVIRNKYSVGEVSTGSRFERHHFVYLAGNIELTDEWCVSPTIFIRAVKNAPFNIEGMLRVQYNKMVWLGVGYRNTQTITLGLGANFARNFRLGYSYDSGIGKFRTVQGGGSHEIVLGFIMGKNRNLSKEIDRGDKSTEESK